MKKINPIFLLFFLGNFLSICGQENNKNQSLVKLAERLPVQTLIDGSQQMGFELFQKLKTQEGNFCFSPYSINFGIAMASLGASGDTATHFEEMMKIPLSFLPVFKDLNKNFFNHKSHSPSQLLMADALWIDKNLELSPSFGKIFENTFQIPFKLVDFQKQKLQVVHDMNRWNSQLTEKKISSLVHPNLISEQDHLILTTAFLAIGKWEKPFNRSETKFLAFHGNKRVISTDFMEMTHNFLSGSDEYYQWLILPFQKMSGVPFQLAFLAVMPKKGILFERLEREMNENLWLKWITNVKEKVVKIQMPRLKMDSNLDLKKIWNEKNKIFTDQANFEKLTPAKKVYLNQAIHQSRLRIDEIGNYASGYVTPSVKPTEKAEELILNQPFIFFIYDQITQTIFLMGRFESP